jgi:hypothetical protein
MILIIDQLSHYIGEHIHQKKTGSVGLISVWHKGTAVLAHILLLMLVI